MILLNKSYCCCHLLKIFGYIVVCNSKLGGMKHWINKKKKRKRPSTSGSQNPNPSLGQIDDHSRVFNGVEEGTSSISIQEHAAAAEIIETPSSLIIVHRDDDFAEGFQNLTETEVDLTFSVRFVPIFSTRTESKKIKRCMVEILLEMNF